MTIKNPSFAPEKKTNDLKTFTSYSGTDIIATLAIPGGKPEVIGELSTISYSIHREKFPVRSLGRINPKGFTNGYRTIAGTLVFTVFDRHVILNTIREGILNQYTGDNADFNSESFEFARNFVTDEMPPFDITLSFINEYGHASSMTIYGITIVDEGQVMSIQDILTENTMSYMACGIDMMTPIDILGNKKE
jgi:hypothetical protein